jgi:hypothetical protein
MERKQHMKSLNILNNSGYETDAEKLASFHNLIRGERNLIQSTITTSDPSFYQRTRANLLKIVEKAQQDLVALDDAYHNGDSIIDAAYERIESLTKQMHVLENKSKVKRLLDLQAQIAALQESVDTGIDEEEIVETPKHVRERVARKYHKGRIDRASAIQLIMQTGTTGEAAARYLSGE